MADDQSQSSGGHLAVTSPTGGRPRSGRVKSAKQRHREFERGWNNSTNEAQVAAQKRLGIRPEQQQQQDDDQDRAAEDFNAVSGPRRGRRGYGYLTTNPLEVLHEQAQENVTAFLKSAQQQMDHALQKVDAQFKRDKQMNRDHYTFSMAVLGELSRVATEAAKAASAASITAAAASTAAAAALAGAAQLEPLVEKAATPESAKEQRKKSKADKRGPQWGYTSRRTSKILKPLGSLGSGLTEAPKKKGGKYSKARKLKADELPSTLRTALAGTDENAFDAEAYALKKQEQVREARRRRGSTLAVALPKIGKRKGKRKGKKGRQAAEEHGSDSEDGDEGGHRRLSITTEEEGVYHAEH